MKHQSGFIKKKKWEYKKQYFGQSQQKNVIKEN